MRSILETRKITKIFSIFIVSTVVQRRASLPLPPLSEKVTRRLKSRWGNWSQDGATKVSATDYYINYGSCSSDTNAKWSAYRTSHSLSSKILSSIRSRSSQKTVRPPWSQASLTRILSLKYSTILSLRSPHITLNSMNSWHARIPKSIALSLWGSISAKKWISSKKSTLNCSRHASSTSKWSSFILSSSPTSSTRMWWIAKASTDWWRSNSTCTSKT